MRRRRPSESDGIFPLFAGTFSRQALRAAYLKMAQGLAYWHSPAGTVLSAHDKYQRCCIFQGGVVYCGFLGERPCAGPGSRIEKPKPWTMETLTFTCKIITPMFLAGADGQTPELRAASIKGALRFWWRACNGHLSLEDLKKREAEIFGGVDGAGRSKVLIRLSHPQLDIKQSPLVPHRDMKAEAIQRGQLFEVTVSLVRKLPDFTFSHLKDLFELTCILGGAGKRVRRGMGSIQIISSSDGNYSPVKVDLSYIHKLISSFSSFYTLTRDSIQFQYTGRSPKYGYIQQIQIGEAEKDEKTLLRTISNATHEVKGRNGRSYNPSMGHASGGRYASPVFVSVIEGSVKPIITTLNLAPDKNEEQASRRIQEEFKDQIL